MAVHDRGPVGCLQRYLDGDRQRVWHELRQLGTRWRELDEREEIEAVVREAMTRASRNVTTIIERLRAQGYRFGDPWSEEHACEPLAPPDEHTPAFVAWLEQRLGPLPLSARLWIELVGDVNLLGIHPSWPRELVADPLVVEVEYKSWLWAQRDRTAVRAQLESARQGWEDYARDGLGDVGCFAIEVAPDALHKANISGGAPYGVLVPDGSVDAMFRFRDGIVLPFIEYLNLAFRHGGFPGLWTHDGGPQTWTQRKALAEGLLEL